MRSTRYIALRKARNRRLRKSLGVAMAKGKMRFNPRDYHPNENYTVQHDEGFTSDHHETYKDNIYNGVPQTLSDGLKNFRHVAGEGADLTNLQNPFANDGRKWSEVIDDTYSPDDLLTPPVLPDGTIHHQAWYSRENRTSVMPGGTDQWGGAEDFVVGLPIRAGIGIEANTELF